MTVLAAYRAIREGQSLTQTWSKLFPQTAAVHAARPLENPGKSSRSSSDLSHSPTRLLRERPRASAREDGFLLRPSGPLPCATREAWGMLIGTVTAARSPRPARSSALSPRSCRPARPRPPRALLLLCNIEDASCGLPLPRGAAAGGPVMVAVPLHCAARPPKTGFLVSLRRPHVGTLLEVSVPSAGLPCPRPVGLVRVVKPRAGPRRRLAPL